MRRAMAIGGANVRRMIRDRSNIFFVFIFPIAIIFLVGSQFGGGVKPAMGVHWEGESDIAFAIVSNLEAIDDIELRRYDTRDDLESSIERGHVQAGLFLPSGMDQVAATGNQVEIGFVARPDGAGPQLQSIAASAVAEVFRPIGAAQFASEHAGVGYDEALDLATGLAAELAGIEVEISAVGEALFPGSLGRFDLGASQQLVLFVFLTALAGSAVLIQTRQLGISSRMLSTPTSTRSIVLGESLGRFSTAMIQGVYIVALTWVIFDVNWGDPLASLVLLVVFALVGAGAGVLMGATFSNDQQAAGVGVVASLGLAAIGGAMMPLELFGDTMRAIAHITPHAWALDGYAELIRRGGGIGDITVELGVLAGYAAVLFGLASWRLRLAITRP